MKHFITILTILICSNVFGQLQTGTYRQGDSVSYADMEIFDNHKFSFYDTRLNSCRLWSKYKGSWVISNDTLIFSWQSSWQEETVQEDKYIDTTIKTILFTFKYDDGEPIQNVKVCYACDWVQTCKYSFTDNQGKIRMPKDGLNDYNNNPCIDTIRRVAYEVKSDFIEFSSSGQYDTKYNVFNITVKKHPKSGYVTDTRKFIVSNDKLIYFDPNETNLAKNWGDFKFLTKKYGR